MPLIIIFFNGEILAMGTRLKLILNRVDMLKGYIWLQDLRFNARDVNRKVLNSESSWWKGGDYLREFLSTVALD